MTYKWLFSFFLLLFSCDSPGSRLDYNDLGIHETIVTGGQREIDQGYVVNVSQSHNLPGIWLAGHHTSHGAVFEDLGDARVDDVVCAYDKCYTVFSTVIVATNYSPPDDLAPLVLQTSWYGRVLLVLAR